MAAGYARWRPAVHPHVIQRIGERLGIAGRLRRALDVGCGAGLSTVPLEQLALDSFGIDPSLEMVSRARRAAPRAAFAAASAEHLPFRSRSIDLITAAGSLNWAGLECFFPEALRVLAPAGRLVVYDFGQGRDLRGSQELATWFARFETRYPLPACREIGLETLRANAAGFRLAGHEEFEVGLELTQEFYLEYILTETNVAAALQRGAPEAEIRDWCEAGLGLVFRGVPREVLFRGFIAWLEPQHQAGAEQGRRRPEE
jgi:SAM-dependent methyltransferase